MISIIRGDTKESLGGIETAFHCTERVIRFSVNVSSVCFKNTKPIQKERSKIVGPMRHSEGKTSFINLR